MASLSVAEAIDKIREYVADQKTIVVNAVDELAASVLSDSAASWGTYLYSSTATGRVGEVFATQHMPLVSGAIVKLNAGRWNYSYGGEYTYPYSALTGSPRTFKISYYNGLFIIPSGAQPIASGERVRLTYSWEESQEYVYSDTVLMRYIPDGYSYVSERYSPTYSVAGYGDTLTFTPLPSGVEAFLLCLATSYLIRKSIFEKEISEAIAVKDGDTSFDTTKKLAHRGKGLEDVRKDIDAIASDLAIGDLDGAGVRIDVYSTKDWNPDAIGGDQEILWSRWGGVGA